MMTPDKIQKFVAAAKAGGHKDDEIAQFIAQQSKGEMQQTAPVVEEKKKGLLQSGLEFFNKGLTQTVGMAFGAPKLGVQAKESDEQIKARGAKQRELALMARNETDPIKKEQLLAESRRLSGEVEQLGAGVTQEATNFQNKFDITEKDIEGGATKFALKRGAKTAIDTGIMLAPVGKIFKTAAGAGKAAKITAAAANSAITGGTISALDEATTLEDITPEQRLDRAITAGIWGTVAGGVLGAGGETVKLLKEKFFRDKKVNQQVAMMFTPDTGEKLKFENSFGTSFEDEFKGRDLSELSAKIGKGELDYKDIKQYFGSKSKDFIAQKEKILTDLTKKTGGANRDDVVTAMRGVISDWAKNNDLSTEEIAKVENLIKTIEKSPAVVPWEKVDNWRRQLGDMGEIAYKTMGATDSIFANAEGTVRQLVEEAAKEVGNVKALNKAISYYKLAEKSIAEKGANELKKVANDMFQFVTQTLPIMAAGGSLGALAGGEDNRGTGAVVGTAAGTLGAVALGKSLRLNMATPEGRIKMANWISKNIEKLKGTPGKLQDFIQSLGRSGAMRLPGQLMMGTPEPAPTPEIEPLPTTEPGMEDVTAQEEMYDVKDNKTGKVVQVPASKLKDYGIDAAAEEPSGELDMEQIAQEVVNAAIRGDSKAVTRWSAALDAAKKVVPTDEKMTEAQKTAKDAAGLAAQALATIQKPGTPIKTGPMGSIEEAKVKFLGAGEQETADFNVMISNLFGTFAKARGGTALTESEKTLLKTYVPAVGDTRQDLVRKLKQIADPKNTALQSALLKGLNSQPVVE